ncbi:MAG: thiamine diphosphokinase [Chloroflexi bacterium]|nr:thiamine diphosphokinase [Chloroflexota bacterium]
MRAVIFVNGLVNDYQLLARWLRPDDLLIGADGGTLHCLALGRQPDVVVGDLDSLDPALIAQLRAQGVQIERHSPVKDQTDLELAIDCAHRHAADEVLLLGALGGRLDQMLANVLILARQDWPFPILIGEGEQIAQVLRGGEMLDVQAPIGSVLSVIPLSECVTGITYTGLEYPLKNVTLPFGSTRGVSNVVQSLPAKIEVAEGLLLVIQTRLQ